MKIQHVSASVPASTNMAVSASVPVSANIPASEERTASLPSPVWVHILDDRSLGGVKRFIEALRSHPSCQGFEHQLVSADEAAAALGPGKIAIVHEPSSWRLLPRLLRWRTRSPVILIEHHYSASFEACNVPHPRRFRWLLRCAYACAHRVVSISEGQAEWMQQHRLVDPERLRRISPFVDLSAFFAAPDPTPASRPVLGAIGRFCPQKGFDLLLQALRRVPNLEFDLRLGGYGPDEAALRELAAVDPRVHFCGRIEDPAGFMARCDALIVPSRWEPFGLVCLEARAAGRPVLVHGVDGLPEQLSGCGLVSPPEAEDLAVGLEIFCDQLPRYDSDVGRESARLSVERSARGWVDLIAELAPLCFRKYYKYAKTDAFGERPTKVPTNWIDEIGHRPIKNSRRAI